ncbi:MAG: efflux RND transporter permease subunit [Bacteroidota bacterium]
MDNQKPNTDNNQGKGLRQFGLSSLAVDNGISVILLTVMIFLFGIQSYQQMPKEQFPEIELPTVYVNTPYFGNSAEDIENLVTRPIEKELQSVDDIKDINSTSIQDFSVIVCEFETYVDIDDAVRKVKDAVDKAKPDLPNDLDQEPTILDVNFSEIPIVTVNISGNFTNDELREYGEYLQDELEDINEINSVELKGTMEREVQIDVDLLKMESMQVTFTDIQNAVSSENVTISGGELVRDDMRRAIRVVGEFDRIEEMENLIVKSENQRPIFLKDIAEVSFDFEDRTSIARSDGLPVVSLDVIKRSGENLLAASDKIKVVVEEARQQLPSELKISLFNDQSINTRNEVSNLENSIISGVILVVLVLLFFLGIRNALFVGVAIPLSMLMGIMFLSLTGVTMNIVVLFALILALGLLVDNAIVVVENIYRYMQEGYTGIQAAKYAAGEVALPIIASTATTLAAFLPLAFWPGLVGSFMLYMPLTLIIVLTSSLIVALVINPVLTSLLMKVDEKAEQKSVYVRKRNNVLIGAGIMLLLSVTFHFADIEWARNLLAFTLGISLLNFFVLRPASFSFQNSFLPVLERFYNSFIRGALKIPFLIFGGTFVLLIFALVLLGIRAPKVILFPSAEPVYVNAFIELPIGKDIEATNDVMRQIEEKVDNAIKPYRGIVEAVLSQIGENTSDPNAPPEPGFSPNKARLTVAFVPAQDRDGISTWDVMDKIREAVKGVPGVLMVVDKNADGPPTGKPINLEVQGEDVDSLVVLSERLINFFNSKNIPGIEELKSDIQIGKPEVVINIDREAARRYEISTFAIADAIRTSVFGKEVSKYKQGEDEYPIMVRLDKKYRYNLDNLLNQKVTFRNPANGQLTQVPISAVADIEYTSSYSAIKRKNLERVVTIFSNVVEGYNANEIVDEMKGLMTNYDLPVGVSYEFTGEQEQQAEDTAFLSGAFIIALFLIFLIIVAQFNSIASPFIIILSILFSTIGVFLGYAFTGKDISVVFTGVGIISLAGVVVNNAIVLIDYINLLIKRSMIEKNIANKFQLTLDEIKEAIIQGGATRLRPVLLTAITTVLGLIPLAIGFNMNFFTLVSELDPNIFIGGDSTAFWGPMAWTVIYGLTFATFLTLVVVPVMFWLSYRLQYAGYRFFNRNKKGAFANTTNPTLSSK